MPFYTMKKKVLHKFLSQKLFTYWEIQYIFSASSCQTLQIWQEWEGGRE